LDATRDRILAAARRLLVERGYHGVGIEEIARAAGVTRQAVYRHHFASKAELLLALVEYVDRVEGIAEITRPVGEARSAAEALELGIRAVVEAMPRVHDIARVLDSARLTDPAAEAAWQDRMAQRRAAMASGVRRLQSEGLLDPRWTVAAATDLVWMMLSTQAYQLLVRERRWTSDEYVERLGRTLRAALLVDRPPGAERSQQSSLPSRPRRSRRRRRLA
jgi:AcrR family transcriptional regulator